MCMDCWEQAGKPRIDNDRVREAARLMDVVYEYSPVGGNAHIVVDDWNVEDEDIRWCLAGLAENQYDDGPDQLGAEKAALDAILALTEQERHSALALHWKYWKS